MGKSSKKDKRDSHHSSAANRLAGDEAGPGPSSQRMGSIHGGQHASKRIKLDLLPMSSTEQPAVACYFPAGQPPEGATYSLYEAPLKGSARTSYTLVGQKANIQYVGRSHGDEYTGPTTQTTRQALGLYNRDTGTLQLIPLVAERVLRMEPRLPDLQYDQATDMDTQGAGADDEPESRERTMAENKRLVASFGSTRRRRQLNQAEEAVLRVEKLGDAQGALHTMLSKMAANAAAEGLSKQQVLADYNAFRILPPFEPTARTPEAAYPLEKLMEGLQHSLKIGTLISAAGSKEMLEECRGKGWVNDYTETRIPLLRDTDVDVVKKRARLLSYLNVLMRLQDKRNMKIDTSKGSEGMAQLAKAVRTSTEVLDPLLSKFYHPSTEGNTIHYTRDKRQETLLLAYICVTALLVERGASIGPEHLSLLASSLKMTPKDLADRCKNVGAVVKSMIFKRETEGVAAKIPSYSATLLPDPSKTLEQCLPTLDRLNRGGRR